MPAGRQVVTRVAGVEYRYAVGDGGGGGGDVVRIWGLR